MTQQQNEKSNEPKIKHHKIELPKGGGADPTLDDKTWKPWPARLDPFSSYKSGFDICTSITKIGYKRGDGGTWLKKSLPPVEMTYSGTPRVVFAEPVQTTCYFRPMGYVDLAPEGKPHLTESNFFVRTEQRRGRQKHAVFVVHPRETLTWHYEQNPSDPRGFPHNASANHPNEQKEVYCTYNESEFINHTPNHYLVGVAESTKNFEIGGLTSALESSDRKDPKEFFKFEELKKHIEGALKVELPFETPAEYRDGGDGYWWNPGLVQHYEDAEHFYLPVRTEDPFGNSVTVEYDAYDLAVIKTTDAEQNESTAKVDYRTLSPKKLTGPNGSSTEAITDPLGLVIATSVYGTEPNAQGQDEPRGDLPLEDYQVEMVPNLRHVIGNPHVYLQNASTFFFYDVDAWKDREEPPQAVGLAREQHVLDPGGEQSPVQVSVTYSDGFGREIQNKLLVEPGVAWKKQPDGTFAEESVPERWLVSGRTVFNNKQKPVKKYEPFYSASPDYVPEEFFATYGVTPVIHYDPLLRVVRTDTSKGFFSKVEFTPWQVTTFDENDTVLDSDYYSKRGTLSAEEQAAIDKATKHADTTSVADLDTLGRQYQVT